MHSLEVAFERRRVSCAIFALGTFEGLLVGMSPKMPHKVGFRAGLELTLFTFKVFVI